MAREVGIFGRRITGAAAASVGLREDTWPVCSPRALDERGPLHYFPAASTHRDDAVAMSEPDLSLTDRSRVRRKAERGTYEWHTVEAILDEALLCHFGFSVDGHPWVLPTTFGRIDRMLYLHGAVGNAALHALSAGAEVCVTITLLDGLVLARSAFHHSMNYRSVMLFGRGEAVTDIDEKCAAMRAIVEHMQRGRWDETRPPSVEELRATLVVRLPIEEGSAKVRSGGPIDEAEDYELPYWAGVIPLALARGDPQPDEPRRVH